MKKLHHRPRPLNGEDLPLFANGSERRLARPLPLPARRIRDRFGLPPAVAVVTAELAGFTEDR
jgi:hypothetical protein